MALNLSEKELRAILKFTTDQAEAERVKKILDDVKKKFKDTEAATEANRKKLMQMREEAEKLQQVGTTLSIAGAAMLAPLLLASRTYLNSLTEGERQSNRFVKAQDRLKEAQIRIGRTTTEILTPLMEKGADLAEKFAELLDKNPGLIKATLAVGGALAAGGAITTLIAQTQKLIATVALLGSGTTAGAAATAASSKVGLPTKVIAAGALYQGLGPVVLSSWLGQAMGIGSLGDRIDKMVNRLGPAFDAVANYLHFSTAEKDYKTGGAKPVTSTEINYSSQMRAYLSYINGLHELDTEYQTNRTKLIRNFQQNEAAELATFTKTIARQTRDFFANERQIEAEYYRNRLQLARSHSLEEQRSEEDHQRDMQRMREDYQDTAQDLIAQRDALGLIRAARAYEKERRRAEEDHDTETARRNQDFAQQMADLAQQFAIGRAQRLANFQQQMKDQKEEFAEQRKQAAAAHRQELQELQENYLKEKRDRRTAFGDQLRDLSDALTQERLLRQKFSEAMLADLKRMIQSATGGNTLPPARDSGGYMLPGVYRNTTGRREFALSPRTVEAAERMAQRSLDQETVLALMANGGALGASQRPTLQYYDHRVINAKLSSEERRQMREDTIQLIGEVLRA